MKLLIVLALFALAVARPDADHYDSKFESLNIDEIIANNRLLKGYGNCFLETGKCTGEGNDIKKMMPEGIATSCAKCTEKQKTLVAKFMKALKDKVPEIYDALIKKHDPEGKNSVELQKFLDKFAV